MGKTAEDIKVIPDIVSDELLRDGLTFCAQGALLLNDYTKIKPDEELSDLINYIHNAIENKNLIPVKR